MKRSHRHFAAGGYSLIELVVVLVLIGILSVYVGPRMTDRGTFAGELYLDEVAVALNSSRMAALASGCAVEFRITSAGYQALRPPTLCNTSSFNTPLTAANGDAIANTAPSGAVFSGPLPQTIRYRPDGSTNIAADLSFSSGARSLIVHANSGVTSTL